MNLREAVNKNDLEFAKKLISEGGNINEADHIGFTAIHNAKSYDMLKLLVKHGANVHLKTKIGRPVFFNAAKNIDMLEFYESLGVDITASNDENENILFEKKCSEEVIKKVVEKGADLTLISNSTDQSLLFNTESLFLAKKVIEKGVSVNLTNAWQQNALFTTISPQITQLLIDNGCNMQARDEDGLCIMLRPETLQTEDLEKLKILIKNKIDINVKDREGKNCLNLLWEGQEHIAELLLEHDIEILIDKPFESDNIYKMALQHIAKCEKHTLTEEVKINKIKILQSRL